MPWRAGMLLLALGACAGTDQATRTAGSAPTAQPAASSAAAQPNRRPAVRPSAGPSVWRVTQDGTTACADRAALVALREQAEPDAAARRRLAAWRAAGGCVTVFRQQPWRLVEAGGETLRLAPAGPGEGATLHFWRDQVAEERAE